MATTVKIETEIYNKISEIAKDENTTENKIINQILKKEIKKENKIPEYLIANKNRNPDPEGLKELIGIIKAPSKDFNPVEAVREVRRGD